MLAVSPGACSYTTAASQLLGLDGQRGEQVTQLLAGESKGIVGAARQCGRHQLVAEDEGGGGGRGGGGGAGRRGRSGCRALQQRRLESAGGAGEAGETEAVMQLGSLLVVVVVERVDAVVVARRLPPLLGVVNEVAAGAVGAEADGVECAAQLRLVLGVAGQAPQFVHAVRELALVAVLAGAALLERPAQLGLVAGGVHLPPARLLLLLDEMQRAERRMLLLVKPLGALAERAIAELILFVQHGRLVRFLDVGERCAGILAGRAVGQRLQVAGRMPS